MYKAMINDVRTVEFGHMTYGSDIHGGTMLWLKDKDHRIIEGFHLGAGGYKMVDKYDGVLHLQSI